MTKSQDLVSTIISKKKKTQRQCPLKLHAYTVWEIQHPVYPVSPLNCAHLMINGGYWDFKLFFLLYAIENAMLFVLIIWNWCTDMLE